tara:strand:- start:219 stop:350 length:132 start_codon:yes stop_codon:yes gene_type:complete
LKKDPKGPKKKDQKKLFQRERGDFYPLFKIYKKKRKDKFPFYF